MPHADPCWRIAAIYRCCYRYNKSKAWCLNQLTKMIRRNQSYNPTPLADIWFRENGGGVSHMDQTREAYHEHLRMVHRQVPHL